MPPKPAAAAKKSRPSASASPAAILAVLAFWFVSCAFFNDLTPRMIGALNERICDSRGAGHTFCAKNSTGQVPDGCGTCGLSEHGCLAPAERHVVGRECVAEGTVGVTMIELAITIAIASTKLKLEGQRVVIPVSVLPRMAAVGALHLGGCRLFLFSLGQGIPVALAQVRSEAEARPAPT
eukprot:SAG22_NODE_5351_length_1031_cov_1.793991_1_plen_179_part_10